MHVHSYDKGWASRLFDTLNIIFLLGVAAATLIPFWHVAVISLSHGNAVIEGRVSLWPVGLNLEAYKTVFHDPAVPRSLRNSTLYTVLGTAINLAMTALCAYPLARPRFFARKALTWMITFTMFFGGGLIPFYLLIVSLGMRDTLWALVIPGAISPWNMFIMRTYFQGIPEEVYEAAFMDGANDLQTLLRIALPLAKPVIATLLLFYAVGHWNDFFNALIFLDDRVRYPIQLIMRNIVLLGQIEQTGQLMASETDYAVIEQTLKYATIMVSSLPILVVYPFVQKYFVKGAMIGSLKG